MYQIFIQFKTWVRFKFWCLSLVSLFVGTMQSLIECFNAKSGLINLLAVWLIAISVALFCQVLTTPCARAARAFPSHSHFCTWERHRGLHGDDVEAQSDVTATSLGGGESRRPLPPPWRRVAWRPDAGGAAGGGAAAAAALRQGGAGGAGGTAATRRIFPRSAILLASAGGRGRGLTPRPALIGGLPRPSRSSPASRGCGRAVPLCV